MKALSTLLTLTALIFTAGAYASDLDKEQRWANSIDATLMDGEIVMLDDGTSEFLSIFTEALEEKKRAAIIMHGTGVHPDWKEVIEPLRIGLTDHGWHTLSIQMPILPNDAEYAEYAPLYDEVAPRIDAAIDFLKAEGYDKIALIGHSQGSAMGSYYLSKNKANVVGFVGVGMPDLYDDARMKNSESLKHITLPVLDIYGSDDLESVLKPSDQRKTAAKQAGNENYTVIVVEGADHFFKDRAKEDELIEKTTEWLEKL
ncbi:MAG: DUF3530 family protein [Gammaproteobacteria bacterium]|jgi:pimeloyl-ACP methyl ester carboxylesterase|nr:DUF3530 family protein [Gammaproteobacteria bacterium]